MSTRGSTLICTCDTKQVAHKQLLLASLIPCRTAVNCMLVEFVGVCSEILESAMTFSFVYIVPECEPAPSSVGR